MANLTDLALATVGVLTIGAYGGLLLQGAPPEQALVLALGGGLVLGILASLAVHLLGGDGPHPLPLSISAEMERGAPETPLSPCPALPDAERAGTSAEDPRPVVPLPAPGRGQERGAPAAPPSAIPSKAERA